MAPFTVVILLCAVSNARSFSLGALNRNDDFDNVDANGDGLVTIDELTALLFAQAVDEIENDILQVADQDGDNELNADEAISVEMTETEFSMADLNGNGKLDLAELGVLLCSSEAAAMAINVVDADGDGAISVAEYEAAGSGLEGFASGEPGSETAQ